MPDYTQIAQRQDRDEDLNLNHRLFIANNPSSYMVESATVTYTTDVGGSGLEMTVLGDLEKYEDERLEFHAGYGEDRVPYFVGKLVSAEDGENTGKSTGQGFGPFRQMAEIDIGKDETFQGQTLKNVAYDLSNRSGLGGNIEVIGGSTYVVPPGEQFPFDTKCLDVLNTLLEAADFVAADMPGGKRIIMPRPRAGSNRGYVGTYGPGTYTGFAITPGETLVPHSVVVYRNGENNLPVVFAEQTCVPDAPRYRRYIVSDFPGTQAEAEQKAYNLALDLRDGERHFTMSTFFNPDLMLWEGFRAIRKKQINGTWWYLGYDCHIDESIVFNYAPGGSMMEVSGSCFEVKRLRVEESEANLISATSPGVARVEPASPGLIPDHMVVA